MPYFTARIRMCLSSVFIKALVRLCAIVFGGKTYTELIAHMQMAVW